MHFQQECGCVAYYMPRDSSSMPICSPSKQKCVDKAIYIVEQTAFDTSGIIFKFLYSPARMKFNKALCM